MSTRSQPGTMTRTVVATHNVTQTAPPLNAAATRTVTSTQTNPPETRTVTSTQTKTQTSRLKPTGDRNEDRDRDGHASSRDSCPHGDGNSPACNRDRDGAEGKALGSWRAPKPGWRTL